MEYKDGMYTNYYITLDSTDVKHSCTVYLKLGKFYAGVNKWKFVEISAEIYGENDLEAYAKTVEFTRKLFDSSVSMDEMGDRFKDELLKLNSDNTKVSVDIYLKDENSDEQG